MWPTSGEKWSGVLLLSGVVLLPSVTRERVSVEDVSETERDIK